MKKLILILLLLTNNVMAETPLQKFWKEFYPTKKCVDIAALGYFIVAAVNGSKDIYEVHTLPSRGSRKAWMRVFNRHYNSAGTIGGFSVKYMGNFPNKTANGFDVTYDMLAECTGKDLK